MLHLILATWQFSHYRTSACNVWKARYYCGKSSCSFVCQSVSL